MCETMLQSLTIITHCDVHAVGLRGQQRKITHCQGNVLCCLGTDHRENNSSSHCFARVHCQGNSSMATPPGNG
jgi:hypothetical protein